MFGDTRRVTEAGEVGNGRVGAGHVLDDLGGRRATGVRPVRLELGMRARAVRPRHGDNNKDTVGVQMVVGIEGVVAVVAVQVGSSTDGRGSNVNAATAWHGQG